MRSIFNEAIGMGSFNDLGLSWWYGNKLRHKIKKNIYERERTHGSRHKNSSLWLIFKAQELNKSSFIFHLAFENLNKKLFLVALYKNVDKLVISITSLLSDGENSLPNAKLFSILGFTTSAPCPKNPASLNFAFLLLSSHSTPT